MSRIGLLSLPRYFNYGSQLQLFALQTTIERLGYECEVIDYVAPSPPPLRTVERLHRILRNPSLLVQGILDRRAQQRESRLTETRRRLFQEFWETYIHLGPRSYQRFSELAHDPPQCDAFVVGSDQVWSPLGHFGDDSYYLAFTEKHRRVAYAPSIGVSEIPETAKSWMRESLNGMSQLSVRESKGADLIRELTGREAQVVVDPTMLLTAEDWDTIVVPPKRERPYVLCYALQSDGYVRNHARAIAEANALDVVVLPFHRSDIESASHDTAREFDVGPREFLGLVRDASFICTDSFHGTVFSVVFRKPFLTFRRYENRTEAATFSRMTDLLDRLKLSDRAMGIDSMLPSTSLVLPYAEAAAAMDEWRAASWSYLQQALQAATDLVEDAATPQADR